MKALACSARLRFSFANLPSPPVSPRPGLGSVLADVLLLRFFVQSTGRPGRPPRPRLLVEMLKAESIPSAQLPPEYLMEEVWLRAENLHF